MFSDLTDWELSIVGLVVAIFIVKPIPLFLEYYSPSNANTIRSSQVLR